MVDQKRLKEVLSYHAETGEFTWLGRRQGTARDGSLAGKVAHMGGCGNLYRRIKIDQREYLAHRLAWLWCYGEFPDGWLDHIDGDGLNNRITNLRRATCAENARNRRRPRTNSSGLKGAVWHKKAGRWQAQLKLEGKAKYLGLFDTAEEAHAAYLSAANEFYKQFARAG